MLIRLLADLFQHLFLVKDNHLDIRVLQRRRDPETSSG